MLKHIALLLNNQINKKEIIQSVFGNHFLQDFIDIRTLQGALFSSVTIDKLIEEEFLHDRIIVNSNENTSLSSMSSGQQKKALLNYQINQHPDFILLDDVYSNVDTATQEQIKTQLLELSNTIRFIQIVFRKADILPFIQDVWKVKSDKTIEVCTADSLLLNETDNHFSTVKLPTATISHDHLPDTLVHLRNIHVAYGDKEVLHNLNWEIRKGEFWQLVGPNGSGKSTLVSMICGDNPKAYGQDMTLFGRKKGSGETIWDIKEKIGYFTPAMTLRFTRHESVENMIISGLNDSVGLYTEPTDLQKKLAKEWMHVLGSSVHKRYFHELSMGQQRMVMVARAMIKQPPLLILDEPTIELDEENTAIFIEMVQAIARQKQTAIVYISHRNEPALQPGMIFELVKTNNAYTGVVKK